MTKSTVIAKWTVGNLDQHRQARISVLLALEWDKNLNLYLILFLFIK